MKTFGLKLGTAYQIYDDCLDIVGSEDTVGKTLGTDLRKGKLTLPILHLLQTSSGQQRQRLSAAILRGEEFGHRVHYHMRERGRSDQFLCHNRPQDPARSP